MYSSSARAEEAGSLPGTEREGFLTAGGGNYGVIPAIIPAEGHNFMMDGLGGGEHHPRPQDRYE